MGPEALLLTALITAGTGTALSAYGSWKQGEQAKAMGDYNAEVAQANAKAAKDKARYDENTMRERTARLAGQQRARYAKGGVDFTEGSPLDVLLQQTEEAEQEALAIQYGGEVASTQYRNQANMQTYSGQNAQTAGYINAGASILKGAGTIGNSYIAGKTYKDYGNKWGGSGDYTGDN